MQAETELWVLMKRLEMFIEMVEAKSRRARTWGECSTPGGWAQGYWEGVEAHSEALALELRRIIEPFGIPASEATGGEAASDV